MRKSENEQKRSENLNSQKNMPLRPSTVARIEYRESSISNGQKTRFRVEIGPEKIFCKKLFFC